MMGEHRRQAHITYVALGTHQPTSRGEAERDNDRRDRPSSFAFARKKGGGTWSPSSCVRDLVTFLPVHVCLLLLGTAAAADADGCGVWAQNGHQARSSDTPDIHYLQLVIKYIQVF